MDPKEKQFKDFKKLDEEWRNEEMGKQTAEVYKDIVSRAMNIVRLDMAKDFDEDLKRLAEELKTAREPYTEGKKTNNLEIRFLIEVLKSRGEKVPGIEDFMQSAAAAAAEQ